MVKKKKNKISEFNSLNQYLELSENSHSQMGNLLSLMGGIGSFEHAYSMIHGKENLAFSNDINQDCCKTLQHHFGGKYGASIIHADVYKIAEKLVIHHGEELKQKYKLINLNKFIEHLFDLSNIAVPKDYETITIRFSEIEKIYRWALKQKNKGISFGWPCQDYSIRNRNANPKSYRAQTYKTALNIVAVLKPKFVICENVKTVPKSVKEEIKLFLKRLGYTVVVRLIKCFDYGSAQWRERNIFVAFKGNHAIFPKARPNTRPIHTFLDPVNADSIFQTSKEKLRFAKTQPKGDWFSFPSQKTKYANGYVLNPNSIYMAAINNLTKSYFFHISCKRLINVPETNRLNGFPAKRKIYYGDKYSLGSYLANTIPVELTVKIMIAITEKIYPHQRIPEELLLI